MRRRAVIAAVWLLGTVASVALAWTAVSAVGGEVTSSPGGGGLSAAQLAERGASTTPPQTPTTATTSTSTTAGIAAPPTTTEVAPAPTTTVATPPAERRSAVFDSVGGTVGASCTGAAASLDFATPRAGYAAEVHDDGPEKVDARFDAGSGVESRIVVRCVDGTPTPEIREDD